MPETAQTVPASKRRKRDSFVGYFMDVRAAILAVVGVLGIGAGGAKFLYGKADVKDVEELKSRQTALEAHHAADDAQMTDIKASVRWQQDTLFRLADRMGVPNVQPTPKPVATPRATPTPASSATGKETP